MSKMNLSEEIEKTLQALDKVKRADVSDAFEKELFQKISFLPVNKAPKWLSYCAAAMLLMILFNGYFLFNTLTTSEDETELSEQLIYQSISYPELDINEY